jgi:hypothetical protein
MLSIDTAIMGQRDTVKHPTAEAEDLHNGVFDDLYLKSSYSHALRKTT